MIERVHEHMISELSQGARTDSIFILTAIVLNLLTLAVNSALASESRDDTTLVVTMGVFVCLTIVVNLVAILGLLKGRQTRQKLQEGLLRMYEDQGVAGYYDASLLGHYRTRYSLFVLAVVFTGLVSIAVPFIVR